jgi:hypothetical protein
MKYDENLPHYFTNHHHFVWNHMNKKLLNDSKIYEKQEIRWFSVKELLTKRNEFRFFYREMVDELKKRVPEIQRFASTKTNKTYKNHSNKTHRSTKKFMGIFSLPYKGG